MKLSIDQTIFLQALQSVARSSGNRATLPVLSNVLLQTDQNSLNLSCTNLEIGIFKSIPANITEEGSTSIPVKMLLDVVSSLSASTINLDSTDDQLTLSCANFTANFNGITASEFPDIPFSSTSTLSLASATLSQALPQITFAAAVDEGRPVLTGILTQIKPQSVEFVATDGFRLAHKTLPLKTDHPSTALIPRRTFEEITRLLSEQKELSDLEISSSDNQNQIIFTLGTTKLSSRLIEGNFPNWEKILPTEFVSHLTIDREELLKSVKLASIFAKDNANIIKFTLSQNKLMISSEAKQLGGQETILDCLTEGQDLTVAFNSRFVIEALTACPGSEIKLNFSGPLSPCQLTPVGESGLEYVIMPIRLG